MGFLRIAAACLVVAALILVAGAAQPKAASKTSLSPLEDDRSRFETDTAAVRRAFATFDAEELEDEASTLRAAKTARKNAGKLRAEAKRKAQSKGA